MYTIKNTNANTPEPETTNNCNPTEIKLEEENNMNANNNMITKATFEDEFTTETNIAINKIEVTFERFVNLKTTEVERVLRTLASVMAEADRHLADGDQYFDYSKDKMDAEIRINMIISLLYKKEGDIETITKDFCYKDSKAEATELSDHYWAFCK